MSWRLRSVRKRILVLALVPVLSLFGLFVFTTSISARNALNLARVTTVKNIAEQPASQFLGAIDAERPLAIVYLADPSPVNRARLNAQAQKTNRAVATMRAAVTSGATMNSATPAENRAIASLLHAPAGRRPLGRRPDRPRLPSC